MIILKEEKDYFMLEDLQGASFASGVIYEGIEEVAEQFIEWADNDGMEKQEGYKMPASIELCLDIWEFNLYKFNGKTFDMITSDNYKEYFNFIK